MTRTPIRAFFAAAIVLAASACGGGSSATASGGPEGGAPSPAGSVTAGTCRFVLRNGDLRTMFDGRARAKMNGSGNLDVQCDATDGGPATLRLGFGNATFDGPRTYKSDDFTSDGSLDYAPGARSVNYSSTQKGAGCTLVLQEAGPLDVRGDSVQKGGRVAATFTCTSIIAGGSTAQPASFVVEEGVVAALVE